MVIAVEIEAAEAYAPLKYLEIAFGDAARLRAARRCSPRSRPSLWAVRLKPARGAARGPVHARARDRRGRHQPRLPRAPLAPQAADGGEGPEAALATDEMVTRFEREVQLCSRLSHPNTIEIYDYGRTRDGTFYYAMEYLEGISLEDLVRRRGRMPVSRAVHVLRQVCGSLKEAHERGLVHRDVKPHNLMLCRHGGELRRGEGARLRPGQGARRTSTRATSRSSRACWARRSTWRPERLRNPADADARGRHLRARRRGLLPAHRPARLRDRRATTTSSTRC